MIAECYDLLLECDYHPPELRRARESFQGQNRTECYRQARAAGWETYRVLFLAKCPACCAAGRMAQVWPAAEGGP